MRINSAEDERFTIAKVTIAKRSLILFEESCVHVSVNTDRLNFKSAISCLVDRTKTMPPFKDDRMFAKTFNNARTWSNRSKLNARVIGNAFYYFFSYRMPPALNDSRCLALLFDEDGFSLPKEIIEGFAIQDKITTVCLIVYSEDFPGDCVRIQSKLFCHCPEDEGDIGILKQSMLA